MAKKIKHQDLEHHLKDDWSRGRKSHILPSTNGSGRLPLMQEIPVRPWLEVPNNGD